LLTELAVLMAAPGSVAAPKVLVGGSINIRALSPSWYLSTTKCVDPCKNVFVSKVTLVLATAALLKPNWKPLPVAVLVLAKSLAPTRALAGVAVLAPAVL